MTDFPWYVTCDFSLPAFSTLSLLYIHSALTTKCYGDFFSFFSLIYLVSCVLLITVWVCFSQFEEIFFCDLVDDLIYAIDLEFFSLIYAYAYTLKVWTRFELFMVFHIPYVLFSWFNFFLLHAPLQILYFTFEPW